MYKLAWSIFWGDNFEFLYFWGDFRKSERFRGLNTDGYFFRLPLNWNILVTSSMFSGSF